MPTLVERRLDLACGPHVTDGFVGVDIVKLPGVDEVVDLLTFPWPWASDSVDLVICSHFLEHVPGRLRGAWMDELWRILKLGGMATILVPHAGTPGAIQDFTHEWPPLCAQSFMYFNRDARRAMGIDHYPVRCHFDYRTTISVERGIEELIVQMVKLDADFRVQ